jgi:hypothetical protein
MILKRLLFFLSVLSVFSIQIVNGQNVQKKKSSSKATIYSEEHAMECLQDYYDFYNADESYSDPKIRRVSNNVFYISVKYCSGGKDICYTQEDIGSWDRPLYLEKKRDFFWHSKVLVLTCTSKTKYTIREKLNF